MKTIICKCQFITPNKFLQNLKHNSFNMAYFPNIFKYQVDIYRLELRTIFHDLCHYFTSRDLKNLLDFYSDFEKIKMLNM